MSTYGSKIIAFEGLDGCGKDTQVDLLLKYFDENNIKYYYAKQLETDLGHYIRENYLAGDKDKEHTVLDMLFAAERFSYCKELFKHLRNGEYIVMNRFLLSALAYGTYVFLVKNNNAFDDYYCFIKDINKYVWQAFYPGITFYLDISPEDSMARIRARNGNKEIYDNLEKLNNISKAYEITIEREYEPNAHEGLRWMDPKLVRINAVDSIDNIHETVVSEFIKYKEEVEKHENNIAGN